MEKQKIELNVPATLSYSALVRHISDEVFASIGFTKEWCSRLKLVVDELYMNAVRYGSMENKSIVRITFSYTDNEVEFKVEDDGTGEKRISVDELKKLIQNNAKNSTVTQTSGRGLALIANLWTDKLDVEPSSVGGIAIYFKKKIETTPPPAPPLLQTVMETSVVPEAKKEPVKTEEKPVEPEVKGESFTIKLHGEIDQHNIEVLTQPVTDQVGTLPENSTLILDFTDVVYINSTFIGHLASWYNEVQNRKGRLEIRNANEQVMDVLDLVGLGRVLTINN